MKLIRKTGLKDIFNEGRNRQCGLFECPVCGDIVERSLYSGKKTKTCGKHEKYIKNKNLHWVWACMKQRCSNQKNKKYDRYGGRGILVCDSWFDFRNFQKWALENGYKDGLTIDRKDNDGDYTPDNCRFVTNAINCQNRENTKMSPDKAENLRSLYRKGIPPGKLSEEFKISSTQVFKIINNRSWVK